ncbi:hypothetical protein KHQ81_11740 [Mycoplasmatota bacterium]|nr:hypothetical protein KHQ81_11740 [Mycoplasmatota bacterium]
MDKIKLFLQFLIILLITVFTYHNFANVILILICTFVYCNIIVLFNRNVKINYKRYIFFVFIFSIFLCILLVFKNQIITLGKYRDITYFNISFCPPVILLLYLYNVLLKKIQ